MKKTNKSKLRFSTESIRQLDSKELADAAGGLCPPATYTCSCFRPGCKD
jgi:hypothetical protein